MSLDMQYPVSLELFILKLPYLGMSEGKGTNGGWIKTEQVIRLGGMIMKARHSGQDRRLLEIIRDCLTLS